MFVVEAEWNHRRFWLRECPIGGGKFTLTDTLTMASKYTSEESAGRSARLLDGLCETCVVKLEGSDHEPCDQMPGAL